MTIYTNRKSSFVNRKFTTILRYQKLLRHPFPFVFFQVYLP